MDSTDIPTIATVLVILAALASVLILRYRRLGASTSYDTGSKPLPTPAAVTTNPIDIATVRIEPGTFMMGDQTTAAGTPSQLVHQVTLTKPFLVGTFPVTVAQFRQFVAETGFRTTSEMTRFSMVAANASQRYRPKFGLNWRNANPGLPDSVPVVCVSWGDAKSFCAWVEKKTGRLTRLPTEAEWEYACRAGTSSKFNVDAAPEALGWFAGNSGDHPFADLALVRQSFAAYKQKVIDEHCRPHPVGQKLPNRWGLHDMHGNVWEWCHDVVAAYPKDPVVDPTGPEDPKARYRIARGGGFFDPPAIGNSFNRGWWSPDLPYYHIGFRIVQEP